jgi:hypothetical protein
VFGWRAIAAAPPASKIEHRVNAVRVSVGERCRGRAFGVIGRLGRAKALDPGARVASRRGDHRSHVDRLAAVLDPEVVLRSDRGTQRPGASVVVRGAGDVTARALTFSRLSPHAKPALVNGAAGVVVVLRGRPFAVMGFTVVGSRIAEINVLSDPERLRHVEFAVLHA